MPRVYIVKYDTDGPGRIVVNGAYDDPNDHYNSFSVSLPVNVGSPIKNQIDKAAIAQYVNDFFQPTPTVGSGDVELVT